jgi:[acyl-carrier-protein] S-malonyltransferase
MADAVSPMRQALDAAHIKAPEITMLASIDASRPQTARDISSCLSLQLAQTLEWHRCLEIAVERGVTCFFELGAGRALTRMVGELFPDIPARAADDFQTLDGVAKWATSAAR